MADGFAQLLRQHRVRRRWSQEQLGLEAEVSPRHLSCLETGKARPSREMVLLLASFLDLDLRERNALLVSAGFAAIYPTTSLDSAYMSHVNRAVDLMLKQQEPYGGVLIDRCWNVLRANDGAQRLLGAFLDTSALPPHVAGNLIRATLHPAGLRPYIVNWKEVASLVLERVERTYHAHPEDEERRLLFEEVRAATKSEAVPAQLRPGPPVAVLHLRRDGRELQIFSLLTTVGTPLDVTAQDLAVESFFPADDATDRWFRTPT